MALRSLDNELPITADSRPRKQAKIVATQNRRANPDDNNGTNDENNLPPQHPPATIDATIDYIPSENLKAFEDPDLKIQGLFEGLESKDWVKVCESLNDTRRFALFHHELLLPILEKVLLVMVKSIKNPRSALCKTSLMASSDIFKAFGEKLLEPISDAFNQLLLQLLLKASQDKKFVCEEAERALSVMVESVPALPLLEKLRAYVGHSNPRVRAKAAASISKCVSKMELKAMEDFGLASLMLMASTCLNDKLPEAREAARCIVVSVYEAATANEEEKKDEFWQSFCQCNLPALHVQAVAKLVVSSQESSSSLV